MELDKKVAPEQMYKLRVLRDLGICSLPTARRWEKAGRLKLVTLPSGHKRLTHSTLLELQGNA